MFSPMQLGYVLRSLAARIMGTKRAGVSRCQVPKTHRCQNTTMIQLVISWYHAGFVVTIPIQIRTHWYITWTIIMYFDGPSIVRFFWEQGSLSPWINDACCALAKLEASEFNDNHMVLCGQSNSKRHSSGQTTPNHHMHQYASICHQSLNKFYGKTSPFLITWTAIGGKFVWSPLLCTQRRLLLALYASKLNELETWDLLFIRILM